jgi:hypothetical protein
MPGIVPLLVSSAIGITAGIIYGLFFLFQRRRALLLEHTHRSQTKTFLANFFLSTARLLLLTLFLYYVLLSPTINFILLISCFLGAFWLIILTKKA